MLTSMYQPMVGALALAVYMTLSQQLPSERVGYSALEQQRKLFLALDLELGEPGRKLLIEQTSKLEAVGLLQTSRRFVQASEDYLYEYQLLQPLGPVEFFRNQHLTLLLRDKIGKYAVLALKEELMADEPGELFTANAEQLTVPFYDIFRLNTQVIDYELEQAIYPSAQETSATADRLDTVTKGFDYADIIMRFPRGSRNRAFVEQLKFRQDQLVAVNMAARKYELTLQETCRLLDEDGVFDEEGMLLSDVLQHRASLFSRQSKRRSELVERGLARKVEGPQDEAELREEKAVEMSYYLEVPVLFQGQCDQHQYNMLLRNDPYTRVLQRFFPQGKVPDGVADIFEKVDLTYKLGEEVINVMIHFIHTDRRSWSKSSIEQLSSDLLGRHVTTYEQAVEYVRDKIQQRHEIAQRLASGSSFGSRSHSGSGAGSKGKAASQKPKLPVASSKTNVAPLTSEELEHIRKLARKLQDG